MLTIRTLAVSGTVPSATEGNFLNSRRPWWSALRASTQGLQVLSRPTIPLKALIVSLTVLASALASASEIVTDENFARAETDLYFTQQVERAPVNSFDHNRESVNVENQMIIRSNTDLLYSTAVVDVSEGATFRLAKGKAFQIMHLFNNDHDNHMAIYGGEELYLDSDKAGTDYVYILMRTAITAGVDEAHRLQDAAVIEAKSSRPFVESAEWDRESRDKVRARWEQRVNSIKPEESFTPGITATPDNEQFMIGTAVGWAGLPAEHAVYRSRGGNGSLDCARVTFQPPDLQYSKGGYWSLTAYSGTGWLMSDQNSVDSTMAKLNTDGTVTVGFNCEDVANNIEVTDKKWNFAVRAYRPADVKKVVSQMEAFPEVQ